MAGWSGGAAGGACTQAASASAAKGRSGRIMEIPSEKTQLYVWICKKSTDVKSEGNHF
jgi:hypothetical protein